MNVDPDTLLHRALASAPRRYRMPPLPADAAAAASCGTEAALAFAIEAARTGRAGAEVRELFMQSLAALVTQALRSDPALQALVLRAGEPQVGAYTDLAAQELADRRRVAARVDAFAHPGKLRSRRRDAARAALEALHALLGQSAWHALRVQAQTLLAAHEPLHAQLQAVLADPALARLERLATLREDAAVQRYLALLAAQGPLAGSEAATQRGRAAARAGEAVEAQTLQAFAVIARRLDALGPRRHRAVRGLRPAAGFAPAPRGAKDEWDVALLREAEGAEAFDIVLLAECKAAPLAATGDWPRLLSGLRRLAQVEAHQAYGFAASEGMLRLRGGSLRMLEPRDGAPPPYVVYACSADEGHVALLSPATRAMLLQEPEAVAFAGALERGAEPPAQQLATLWDTLQHAPRLRPVLHQYETARRSREAMLHPDDLLAALGETPPATEIAT